SADLHLLAADDHAAARAGALRGKRHARAHLPVRPMAAAEAVERGMPAAGGAAHGAAADSGGTGPMNVPLILELVQLRYKLLWAKTRSRNGRIALFLAGYLLLALVGI